MASTVTVDLGDRSYPIEIGVDVSAGLGEMCRTLGFRDAALIVSDSNVYPLYGEGCKRGLEDAGLRVAEAVVPAGEASKSEEQLFALYDAALANGLDRTSLVVALGGGVVGDLAGYMAASYLRGVHYLQVPTSLLAMVDSAVGGKTAINLPQGKNLIGAFYQPVAVNADLGTLETLPEREYLSGLAEVVKYGVIRDAGFFTQLETHADALRDVNLDALEPVVARCCEIKAEVVHEDEREGGLRAILNFGHTLGHAIEQVSGYGTFLHGEAVAMGMVYAAEVSVRALGFPAAEAERLRVLLERLGLPVTMPSCSWAALRQAMGVDKKVKGRVPRFVLAPTLGHVTFGNEVEEQVLEASWKAL